MVAVAVRAAPAPGPRPVVFSVRISGGVDLGLVPLASDHGEGDMQYGTLVALVARLMESAGVLTMLLGTLVAAWSVTSRQIKCRKSAWSFLAPLLRTRGRFRCLPPGPRSARDPLG